MQKLGEREGSEYGVDNVHALEICVHHNFLCKDFGKFTTSFSNCPFFYLKKKPVTLVNYVNSIMFFLHTRNTAVLNTIEQNPIRAARLYSGWLYVVDSQLLITLVMKAVKMHYTSYSSMILIIFHPHLWIFVLDFLKIQWLVVSLTLA